GSRSCALVRSANVTHASRPPRPGSQARGSRYLRSTNPAGDDLTIACVAEPIAQALLKHRRESILPDLVRKRRLPPRVVRCHPGCCVRARTILPRNSRRNFAQYNCERPELTRKIRVRRRREQPTKGKSK